MSSHCSPFFSFRPDALNSIFPQVDLHEPSLPISVRDSFSNRLKLSLLRLS